MALVIPFLALIILAQLGLIWGLVNRLLLVSRVPKIDVPVPAPAFQKMEPPERPKNKLFSVRVQG